MSLDSQLKLGPLSHVYRGLSPSPLGGLLPGHQERLECPFRSTRTWFLSLRFNIRGFPELTLLFVGQLIERLQICSHARREQKATSTRIGWDIISIMHFIDHPSSGRIPVSAGDKIPQ